jgi:hypothetical protein
MSIIDLLPEEKRQLCDYARKIIISPSRYPDTFCSVNPANTARLFLRRIVFFRHLNFFIVCFHIFLMWYYGPVFRQSSSSIVSTPVGIMLLKDLVWLGFFMISPTGIRLRGGPNRFVEITRADSPS